VITLLLVNNGFCSNIIEFKKNVKSNPESFSANFDMGSYYEKKGDYNKAITYLDKAIKLDNKKIITYILLGSSYDSLGYYKKSVKIYKKALKIDPKNDLICSMLAMDLTELRDFKSAVKYFMRAIELNKKNSGDSGILFGLGNAYVNLKKYKKAIGPLKKALNINPELKNAVLLLGLSYEEIGESEKAFDQYVKLQKIDRELSLILLEYLSRS
jgi:tetratricopeptide (TPR) repeat protein